MISDLVMEEELSELIIEQSFSKIEIDESFNMENLLTIFCHQSKNILNMIIEKNPSLLFGTFKVAIKKYPNIISFENRRRHFYEKI